MSTLRCARVALVVDVDRAARVVDGAVVDDRAQRRRDPLADLAGVVRGLLAVEVGLQAVADRLVQQDPRVAGAQHHLHRAGRRVDGVEHGDRQARRLAPVLLGALPGAREVLHAEAPARRPSGRPAACPALLGDGADAEAHHRLAVARQVPVGGDDQDLALAPRRATPRTRTMRGSNGARGARRPRRSSASLSAPARVSSDGSRDRVEVGQRHRPDRDRRRRRAPPTAICAAVRAASSMRSSASSSV